MSIRTSGAPTFVALILAGACTGGGAGGGDDGIEPDAAVGSAGADASEQLGACGAMPDMIADMTLPAFKAQRCNVPGTSGTKKWFRISAQLPGSQDFVQLELWPETGAYAGAVTTGTFDLAGADLVYETCGVCGRGIGDKGDVAQKEYFSQNGSVNVTSIGTAGQTLSATLSNVGLVVVDFAHRPASGGCTTTVQNLTISGTIEEVGGASTGGGGGGGGAGGGSCELGVGD
jgi:hypothetical protein